jgi:hypothetical protein
VQFRIGGISPEKEASALEYFNSPEMAVELLLQEGYARELHENARRGDEESADKCEAIRAKLAAANLTTEQRFGFEMAEFISQGQAHFAFLKALDEVGLSQSAFFDELSRRGTFKDFFNSITSLYVLMSLIAARDKDLVRPIHRNDFKDIMALSVAMPYCSLVVSENHWGHMVKALKLDEQYDTTLITDARKLPDELAKIGCG